MPDEPTIFARILDGEIPCHRVYEDEHVLSFLDAFPIAPGHTLLIPKQRVAFLHELSETSAAALGRALPHVAAAVMAATGTESYNVLQNNGAPAHQVVLHVHFHIIPHTDQHGLGLGWDAAPLQDEVASDLAGKMRAALGT